MTDSLLLLTWHVAVTYGWAFLTYHIHRADHVPFAHPLFLNPFAKFTLKGISLFHLCVCLFQNCTSHNLFWGSPGSFGRMEVRLFFTINHSGPLVTRSFPERGQREWKMRSLDTPEAQTSVNVQVNEFWVSGTKSSVPGCSWHRPQNSKRMWGNSEILTEHVTHSALPPKKT